MSATWLRSRLHERRAHVDPEEYAMCLFYAHHDYKHYEQCKQSLRHNAR